MRKLLVMLLVMALWGGTALAGPDAARADGAGTGEARFSIPDVPAIKTPEIKVPKVPEKKSSESKKIKAPTIPSVELPQADIPWTTAPTPVDPETDAGASPEALGVEEALDALGGGVYRATYEALLGGEVVKKGSKGEIARGVQQTLAAFGQDIQVDGDVGPKTMAALNAVQAALGLEQTESLDAEGYGALLQRLAAAAAP